MSSLFFFFFFPIDGLIKSKIPFPRGLKFNFFSFVEKSKFTFPFLSQYRIRKRQQFRPFSLTYNSLLTPALAECMLTGEGIIIKEPSLSLSLWNTFFFFIGSRLAAKPLVHAITLLRHTLFFLHSFCPFVYNQISTTSPSVHRHSGSAPLPIFLTVCLPFCSSVKIYVLG